MGNTTVAESVEFRKRAFADHFGGPCSVFVYSIFVRDLFGAQRAESSGV